MRLRLLLLTSSHPNAVLWYIFFVSTSTLLMLNTLDQTILVCISPPGHFPYQDNLDIFISDTDMESEEDAEMLFGLASGPSHLRHAIPQHDDNEAIIISDSKPESEADSRDIVGMGKVSLSLLSSLPLSLICLSFATGKAMGLGCCVTLSSRAMDRFGLPGLRYLFTSGLLTLSVINDIISSYVPSSIS